MPRRQPTRGQIAVGAIIPVLAIVAAVWIGQSWGGAFATHLVGDVASLMGALIAAGCTGWAARSSGARERRGWLVLTAGLLVWALGAAVWSYFETWLGIDPFPGPSTADVAFLLFPVCAVVALLWLWLPTAISRKARIRQVLDGLIVTISVIILAWVALLERVFHAGNHSSLTIAVSLTYLIVDAAAFAVATLVFAGAVPARRPSLVFLATGVGLMAVADFALTYLAMVDGARADHIIDLARFVAFGLVALAALSGVREPRGQSLPIAPRVRLWLPYLPLVFAVGIWFGRVLPQIGFVLLILAFLLVTITLVRQFVVLDENRHLLSDVAELAYHDQLTGLPNRTEFLDRLERAVRRREAGPLAVLCLDLDNFKTVNDDLGHPAGDELLVRVAGRLSNCLSASESVARLGGDEFAVLVEASVDQALAAADRILDVFGSPIVLDGVAVTVRPSIGLTLATDDPSLTTVDDLLRQADLAMYAAKRSGGGCVRSFVPGLPNPCEMPGRSAPPDRPPTDDMPVAQDQPTSTPRGQRLPSAVRWALAVLAIGLVVFTISTFLRDHPGRSVLLDSWLYDTLMLATAAVVLARAWRVPYERWAWALIGAGMAISGFGDVVYALWVPEGASPSLADPLYLAFYPLGYAGLLLLVRTNLRRVPTAIVLDGLVVGCTVAAISAALTFGPIRAVAVGSPATVYVGLAYAAGDLVMLALAGGVLALLGWRTDLRWGLLVAGFVVWAVADAFYLFRTAEGAYVEGTWIDAGWPAAYLLLALASWSPSATAVLRAKPGLGSFAAPVICAVLALGVSVSAFGDRLSVALAAVTLIAVAVRFAVTFRDVSAMAQGHQQAMTDELTGLANRRALATALTAAAFERAPEGSELPRSRLGLLLLDVDQFGEINDSLGRGIGDELLRRIANRLSNSVRQGDLLVRTGADEFAVLLTGPLDLTTARAHAGCLVEALREPFALDHITVRADVRVAIALCPDHCAQPEQLLSRAEATIVHPRTSVGRIAVYHQAVDLPTNSGDRLVKALRTALHTDQLICHYQPKISAADEQVHSVEALVRWNHPTRGLLLPDQFLPAAERAGLMRPVTTRVLDIALAQIRAWRDDGIALTLAVNLSTTNLLDLDLVGTITRLLRTHQIPVETLILEITESTLTTDSHRARNTVAALRQLGIRLSIDDYGTGWSSLARLQDLSVDELKLDRVFVARLANDPRSIAIVRSTVALAHSLGADLVAEGVEDVDTLNALRMYGCNITQGHVHSPPLPADVLKEWLDNRMHDPQFGVGARVG
ncbi:diguanylate cyclase domain-containing protein [Mycobacterium sp. URHB0021]